MHRWGAIIWFNEVSHVDYRDYLSASQGIHDQHDSSSLQKLRRAEAGERE